MVAQIFLSFLLITGASSFAFVSKSTSPPITQIKASKSCDDNIAGFFAAVALSIAVLVHPDPAFADGNTKEFKFPPIDKSDKQRCKLVSSKMGQANAARDKLYDLRECDLSGKDASEFDLSGVIMTKTDMSNTKLDSAYFSKGFLHDSNFENADFSNAIVDRASFKGSNLKNARFTNTVLTGTSFEGANVENVDFTDAYLGDFDIKSLCKNPTLKGENSITGEDTKFSVGCGGKR